MKILNINHSIANILDNYCDTSLELTNNYSNIRSLNIFNSLSCLFGKYTCNINIYNSTFLYLEDSFVLNSKSFYFIGNNLSPLDIIIEGNLNTLSTPLNISSTGNINLTTKLLSNNISKGSTIKILLNDRNTCLSSFLVNSDLSNIENSIPIVLYCKNYNKLIINSDLKFLDFASCKNLEFTLMPNKVISSFTNINRNTFKFLNTTVDSLLILKNQYPNISFKIKSLFFDNPLLDGEEVIIVPKCFCSPTGISVLIENTEYTLNLP